MREGHCSGRGATSASGTRDRNQGGDGGGEAGRAQSGSRQGRARPILDREGSVIDGRNGDEWNVVARVVVLSHLLPERRRSIKPTPRKHRSTTGGVGAAAPWSEYKRRCNAGGRAGGGRARGGPSGRGDMALAIRGLGAKSLEVPIAAVATSTLVLFSDVVRDMDKALHKGWISRQRNLFQKGSGTTKDGRLSFRFISSSSCEPLATLGGGGRRLSNFQASHLIVQQAEPVGRTES